MDDVVDSRGRPRSESWTVNDEPSMTIQSDADEADIKHILGKFQTFGVLGQQLDEAEAMFLDVSEFTDLADAMRQSRIAEVQFMKLPSKVREIFDHDVANWLDTAHDPEKRDALADAGYIKRTKAAEPVVPNVVAPVAPVDVEKVSETE